MAYLKPVRKYRKDGSFSIYYFAETKGMKPRSLKTTDIEIAEERFEEYEDYENRIKRGIEVNFTWENNSHYKPRIEKKTLQWLIPKYISYKKAEGVRDSTIKRNINSFNCLINVLGRTYLLSDINNKSI